MNSPLFCDNCGASNQPQALYCRSCGRTLQAAKPSIYDSGTGRLLAKSVLKQRYSIIAPAGKGGMGAVYEAEDIQLGDRRVALKEMSQNALSPQEQKEAAAAFKQEAIMLARLHHPNLPSIFDHFEESGRWYLVMSFIAGETLADYISHAQGERLPLDEVLQIGLQLCTVLGYLHSQQPGIVFRDLKPANIMRTPDGHSYLIDFGIARHFKPGQAKDTAYYGSMGYAPPEQYGQAQTTPRSDIYSLGATLYQMLSGHSPSSTPFRFPPLQSLVPGIPVNLATLITRMTELDETQRPANILIIKQELQALASPAAKSSNPPTAATPTQISTPKFLPVASPAQAATPKFLPAASPAQPVQPRLNPSATTYNTLASSSAPVAATPPMVPPFKGWAFGKRQIVTMLSLAGFYSLITFGLLLLLHLANGIVSGILVGFLFFFPIFFGSFFGPWVGIGASGIGFSLLVFGTNEAGMSLGLEWWVGVTIVCSAFLAGLLFIKMKGSYNTLKRMLFAWVFGTLDTFLVLLVLLAIPSILYNFNSFRYLVENLPLLIPTVILLPLLLIIGERMKQVRQHRKVRAPYP